MDNPWRIKFDSTLQSSMLSMASSASQEPRDQVINASIYIYVSKSRLRAVDFFFLPVKRIRCEGNRDVSCFFLCLGFERFY